MRLKTELLQLSAIAFKYEFFVSCWEGAVTAVLLPGFAIRCTRIVWTLGGALSTEPEIRHVWKLTSSAM